MLTCTYTHDEMHEHSHTNKSMNFMKEQMFVLLYNGEIQYVTDTLPFLNNIFLCFQIAFLIFWGDVQLIYKSMYICKTTNGHLM